MNANRSIQRAYELGPYGQLHYRRAGPAGARSPLLLLHPCPASGYVFETFMAEMGRDRTVIAADLPGYGMSDAPKAEPTIGHYAAAMLELVAELGLGVVDVVGYHAGGPVALEMAAQQPYVVRKIVMIGAPLFNADEIKRVNERAKTLGPEERAAGFGQGWTGFKTGFWRMGDDDVRTWNIYLEGQHNPATSHWGARAVLGYDTAKMLAAVAQPILVLNPEDDLAAITPRAAKLMKSGRVHNLPGWGHGFLDAKAAETAVIVRGFLD